METMDKIRQIINDDLNVINRLSYNSNFRCLIPIMEFALNNWKIPNSIVAVNYAEHKKIDSRETLTAQAICQDGRFQISIVDNENSNEVAAQILHEFTHIYNCTQNYKHITNEPLNLSNARLTTGEPFTFEPDCNYRVYNDVFALKSHKSLILNKLLDHFIPFVNKDPARKNYLRIINSLSEKAEKTFNFKMDDTSATLEYSNVTEFPTYAHQLLYLLYKNNINASITEVLESIIIAFINTETLGNIIYEKNDKDETKMLGVIKNLSEVYNQIVSIPLKT